MSDDKVMLIVDEKQLSAASSQTTFFGLTVDAENNVFTADYNNKKVLKITPDKRISSVYQSEAGWSPTGVFAKNKNLYVLEIKNTENRQNVTRVRKIASDGKVSTVAAIGENQTNAPQNSNQNPEIELSKNQPPKENRNSCAFLGLIVVVACACSIFRKSNYAS